MRVLGMDIMCVFGIISTQVSAAMAICHSEIKFYYCTLRTTSPVPAEAELLSRKLDPIQKPDCLPNWPSVPCAKGPANSKPRRGLSDLQSDLKKFDDPQIVVS